MLRRSLLGLTLLMLLVGCGSQPAPVQNGPLVNKTLHVFTYGKPYDELEKKLRFLHGRKLTQSFDQQQLFAHHEYVGDGKEVAGYDTLLRITFVYANQGITEWPLEVKVHYILEDQGQILFNQVYNIEANQFNAATACAGCASSDVALALLTQKVLPELKKTLLNK